MEYILLIVLLVFMIIMMFTSSKKAKKQQEERRNFWTNLQPGTEVITIGGIIGKVVQVDEEYEEIVIETEGTPMRLAFRSISKEYVRPAYVHDDEVDEQGNSLDQDSPARIPAVDQEEPVDPADQTAASEDQQR
ncbi:preprotein translocase subunit YajC [Bifidobacterium cuniculi]|uniref:Protein translocase subunit YajC n=1 Tax=Bifidobacterium cuniculi TaxID=1688 RepID=A0A087AW22_9BIFI|nr:preprotein translocase subunit YajC [Bifidobacterium cuniculi]KFI62972.1 protein translocase subunit YajC [Bifidobacterium cuniculi]